MMTSPFHLVLYIFIAILVLLCLATLAMYLYDLCSTVCSDNYTDLESYIADTEQRQMVASTDVKFIEEGEDNVPNISKIAFGFEHDMPHLHLMEKDVSSNLDCAVNPDPSTNSKNAHSMYPKPMQLAMMDTQFSSKRKPATAPTYSKIVTPKPVAPSKSGKNAASLKRKAPSAPGRPRRL